MQFVVFMELVGTLALPAAISFTVYLIIIAIMGQPAILPLILLALILGLPAVLIVMTSRKIVYVGWMLIYLISLPIWNFVLPTYAYWHFDDFSWGDTRKVEGIAKDKGHGDEGGKFDSSVITMKKWNEYEMERRTKLAREQNMPAPRFIERHLSVDVFREFDYNQNRMVRRYSNVSNGSAHIPLTHPTPEFNTNTAVGQYVGETSSTPLGITPAARIQLADSPVPDDSTADQFDMTEIKTQTVSSDSKSIENHELGWIQQTAHDNNWANPALHHNQHIQNQEEQPQHHNQQDDQPEPELKQATDDDLNHQKK
jgi:chitin synthase